MRVSLAIAILISTLEIVPGATIYAQAEYAPFSGGPVPCNNSQTLFGGTATASCDSVVNSSASYYGDFSGEALTEYDVTPPASISGIASVTDDELEDLVVGGDTGTGTLTIYFLVSGNGGEIGDISLSTMEFATNFGSFENPFPTCDSNGDCSWSIDSVEALTIPVTFGVPFVLTEDFTLYASAGNDAYGGASAVGSVQQTGFSVVDSSDNSIPDAQLSTAPEPSSSALLGLSLGLLFGMQCRGHCRACPLKG
jgi:hypothetical protein